MQIDHLQDCAHKPCACQVTQSDEYCGENCRKQATAGGDTCTCICGNTDCTLSERSGSTSASTA